MTDNDLSPSSTVSTATSTQTSRSFTTFSTLYEALQERAVKLQIPSILSCLSNRIYGRRQVYCVKDHCHPFHIFFALYSIPCECSKVPESIKHDVNSFRAEAKTLFAESVWSATRTLKSTQARPEEVEIANVQLAGAEILSGNLIAARRRTEACLNSSNSKCLLKSDPVAAMISRVIVLFHTFALFHDGSASSALRLLSQHKSLLNTDPWAMKLLADGLYSDFRDRPLGADSYSTILGVSVVRANTAPSSLRRPGVTSSSARIAQASLASQLPSEQITRMMIRLFDHRTDKRERLRILQETEKLPGIWKDEPATWLNHTCALESALEMGARGESERIAERLARIVPDAGTDKTENQRLFNLKTLLRRDIFVSEAEAIYASKHLTEKAAVRISFADIIFGEWLFLWPPELISYALEYARAPGVPSSESDVSEIARAEMLLAHEAMMHQRFLSAIEHSERSRLCFAASTEDWAAGSQVYIDYPLRLPLVATYALVKLLSLTETEDNAKVANAAEVWEAELSRLLMDSKQSSGVLRIMAGIFCLKKPKSDLKQALRYLKSAATASERQGQTRRLSQVFRAVPQGPHFPEIQIQYDEVDYVISLDQEKLSHDLNGPLSYKTRDQIWNLYTGILESSFRKDLRSVLEGESVGPEEQTMLAMALERQGSELLRLFEQQPSTARGLRQKELFMSLLVWFDRMSDALGNARSLAKDPNVSILAVYWLAADAARKGDDKACVALCEKVWPRVCSHPAQNTRFYEMYASSLLGLGKVEECIEKYIDILKVDEFHIRAVYQVASLTERRLGDTQRAAPHYEKVLEVARELRTMGRVAEPGSDETSVRLRRIFRPTGPSPVTFSIKDVQKYLLWALLGLATHCFRWPRGHIATDGSVFFREHEDQLKRGSELIEEALQVSADDLMARNLKGLALCRQGDYAGLKTLLSACASSQSSRSTAENVAHKELLLAVANERLCLISVAEDHVKRSLNALPDYVMAMFYSAIIIMRADSHQSYEETLAAASNVAGRALAVAQTTEELIIVDSFYQYLRSLRVPTDRSECVRAVDTRVNTLDTVALSPDFSSLDAYLWLSPGNLRQQLRIWQLLILLRSEDGEGARAVGGVTKEQLTRAYIRQGCSSERRYVESLKLFECVLLTSNTAYLSEVEKIACEIPVLANAAPMVLKAVQELGLHKADVRKKLMQKTEWLVVLGNDIELLEAFVVSKALAKWVPPRETSLKIRPVPAIPINVHNVAPRVQGSPKLRAQMGAPLHVREHMNCPLDQLFRVPIAIPASKLLTPDDFVLGQMLGSGGFGTVYSGRMVRSGRTVAIKLLRLSWSASAVRDLISEVNAIAKLRHENLVEFVGACLDPKQCSLVTELCARGSLYARLHQSNAPPWPWTRRCQVAEQITSAVEYLHSQNPKVVHRDLKSMNVVLDHKGIAKVCDFGLTHSMEVGKTHMSMGKEARGGSPRYMAPECFSSAGRISEKVDIWALACVLIEVFGGQVPFAECKEVAHVMRAVVVDRKTPRIPSHFPQALRSLLQECFSWDSHQRPSASQIQEVVRMIRAAAVA